VRASDDHSLVTVGNIVMRFLPIACVALVAAAHTSDAQESYTVRSHQPSILVQQQSSFKKLSIPSRSASVQQDEKQLSVSYVPSVRLDLIAGSVTAVHVGASLLVPVSNYFGIGGTAAAGISEDGFSGRGDLYGRFSLDPYRHYAWEPYFGVGGTVRMDSGGPGTRSYLLGFVGFNGPKAGKIAPGFEVGVGGGLRFGVTLRLVK
jgi:hypothetical protein